MTNKRRKIRKNCNKYHSKYYTVKRINIKNIMLLVVALILISALVTKGVTFFTSKNKSVNVVQKDIKMQKNADNTTEKDIKNENTNVKRTDVSIVAVGDNLVSDSVLYTAQRYGGGKYDFSEVFEKMIKEVENKLDAKLRNKQGNNLFVFIKITKKLLIK